MKTQTYFLNGKALAIVVGGLAGSGALIFLLGVIVGLSIDPPAIRAGLPGIPSLPGAAPIASTSMISSANADASGAPSGGEAAAAWPFSMPGAPSAPAAADSTAPAATPAPSAPAPAAKGDTSTKRRATITDAAYLTPEPATRVADDTRRYTVQVGAFRVERNAQALADRLQAGGYRPVVTLRTEGDRALHVVSVGGYVGRRAAIMASVKIGDAEHLVASPVPARGR